jgi:hypothetical protein
MFSEVCERPNASRGCGHGGYHIPACAKGEAHAAVLITSRGDVLELVTPKISVYDLSARDCGGSAARPA